MRCIQPLFDDIAYSRESPVVSGTAIPPPKFPPLDVILYCRESQVVSGNAIPPPKFPLLLRYVWCFARSVMSFSSVELLDGETEVSEVELGKVEVSPPIANAELLGAGAYGEPYAPLPG